MINNSKTTNCSVINKFTITFLLINYLFECGGQRVKFSLWLFVFLCCRQGHTLTLDQRFWFWFWFWQTLLSIIWNRRLTAAGELHINMWDVDRQWTTWSWWWHHTPSPQQLLSHSVWISGSHQTTTSIRTQWVRKRIPILSFKIFVFLLHPYLCPLGAPCSFMSLKVVWND